MSCSLQRSKATVKAKGLAWTKWVLGQSLPHRPQDFLLDTSLIAELPRKNSVLQAAPFTVEHNTIVAADDRPAVADAAAVARYLGSRRFGCAILRHLCPSLDH